MTVVSWSLSGPVVRTFCLLRFRVPLLLFLQLLLELARPIDRRALTELLELEDLPDLDLTLLAVVVLSGLDRDALGPFDGLRVP